MVPAALPCSLSCSTIKARGNCQLVSVAETDIRAPPLPTLESAQWAVFLIVSLVAKESWAPKNWCFWTVVLEKTLESPLDFKEIQPVHPKGSRSWIFIGRTDAEAPILWPHDMKNWLIGKDPDAGRYWGQEEKGTTEDEIVEWHHRLNRREFVHYLKWR